MFQNFLNFIFMRNLRLKRLSQKLLTNLESEITEEFLELLLQRIHVGQRVHVQRPSVAPDGLLVGRHVERRRKAGRGIAVADARTPFPSDR